MAWNETTRKQYSRETERYESDLTNAEWALLAPLLPPPSRRGHPRRVDLREVVNAIAYLLWTGCSWRALPKDFPAFTTVQDYFYPWSRSGVLDRIDAHLTALGRHRSGRAAAPSAAIIDSQSVPPVEAGGRIAVTMPARRSRGANATLPWMSTATRLPPRGPIRPTSRIAMARFPCSWSYRRGR